MYNKRFPTSLCPDMVVSHLKDQIVLLHNILETIERQSTYQEEYITESIKSVEKELRRLRKIIEL